jgi:TatA/E family protein of Tat protein translocase
MFGLGMGELLIILAIALIFLGPKRLPDVATSLGKAIRGFRKATRDLSDQLEIDDEVKKPLRELQSALRDDPVPHQPLAVMQPPVNKETDKDQGMPPLPVAKGAEPAAPVGTAAPPLDVKPPTTVAAKPADKKA